MRRYSGALDGLPLALEQAASYIAYHELSLEGYLEEWRTVRDRVLKWHSDEMGCRAPVAATWLTSFESLGARPRAVLRLLAHLAPEPVPVGMLVMDFGPGQPSDVRTWPVWDRLRPHAERVIELAASVGVEDSASVLMNELSMLLLGKAVYSEAEPLMRRALSIDEKALGEEHPYVARDLNNLAQLLKATNRLSEAEPLMRRALSIDEASLPEHHPWVQGFRKNLDVLLRALEDDREE